MHETERHRVILAAVQSRPVATVSDLVELTGTSEATIRRDIAALHLAGRLRRLRGGAEAVNPPSQSALVGRPFAVNETINVGLKRAIAREAVALIGDADAIIVNGGTTTFQMVYPLLARRLQILTNSFAIAEHLLHHSRNTVTLPGGTIYREQNIILSPFENDVSQSFYAHKMFVGVQAIGARGIMEADPLVIQAEHKLISQADELIVLADSSKFRARSSLILSPLERVHAVITDRGIRDDDRLMLEKAGVRLIVAEAGEAAEAAVA